MVVRSLALVGLVAVGGSGAASVDDPAFRVTMKATLTEVAVHDLRGEAAPECAFVHKGRATRTIVLTTVEPVTTTLSRLKRWPLPRTAPLRGYEVRSGSFRVGYEGTCLPEAMKGPRGTEPTATEGGSGPPRTWYPAQLDDTSGCGRRPLETRGARFGYADWPDRGFDVLIRRAGPDPYGGRCLTSLYGEGNLKYWPPPLGKPPIRASARFELPPGNAWGSWLKPPRDPTVDVSPARFAAGKTVVLRFSDRASARPEFDFWGTPEPPPRSAIASTADYRVTWEIRLEPVPR